MSARGSAAMTALRISWSRASDGKWVTTDVPSSCTPCDPDSKSAAITPSRLESGVIRSEIHVTDSEAPLFVLTATEDYLPGAVGGQADGCGLQQSKRFRSRAEGFLQFRPQAFRPALGNFLNFAQSPKQCRLFVRVGVGRPQLQPHVQISSRARVDPRQSPSAQIEYLPALGSTGYLQGHRPADHRHFDIGAEGELWIRDQHFGVEILAVALESWIFLHLEHHEDVSSRSTPWSDIAHGAHGHVLTRRYAGRNAHRDLLFSSNAPLAPALLARRSNDRPFAGARRAWRDAY